MYTSTVFRFQWKSLTLYQSCKACSITNFKFALNYYQDKNYCFIFYHWQSCNFCKEFSNDSIFNLSLFSPSGQIRNSQILVKMNFPNLELCTKCNPLRYFVKSGAKFFTLIIVLLVFLRCQTYSDARLNWQIIIFLFIKELIMFL